MQEAAEGGSQLHPTVAISLSARDVSVLTFLCKWTRLLSELRVVHFTGSIAAARSCVRRLADADLIERYQVLAKSIVPTEAVLRFYPGDPEPNFVAVSKALRVRQTGSARHVPVVRLTAKGAALFGSSKPPRRVRASEATHDLQLAQTAIAFWSRGGARWKSEDEIRSNWTGVLPDAEVEVRGDRFVLEGGGDGYSASKLAEFHEHVAPELQPRGFSHYAIF